MTTQAATELAGGVPTNGLTGEVGEGGQAIAGIVGEVEQQFGGFGECHAKPWVLVDDGASATGVDDDEARVRCGFGGEARGGCLKTVAIAGVERGQTAAAADGAHGTASEFRGDVQRIFGDIFLEARVAAADEHAGDGFVSAGAGFKLVEGVGGFLVANGGSSGGGDGFGRSGAAGEEVGAGIDEDCGRFVAMVALLATRVAAGAGPRGGRVLGVDRDVAASCEVRHAHFAPGRDGFAGFGVGDGARGAAEFGAVDARLEGAFVCRDDGQTEHVGSVRASRCGCNWGLGGRRGKREGGWRGGVGGGGRMRLLG